ncbi:MAG: Fic family protein [Methylobacter sp.]|nr:Fic family protein [Methylobacter sp.]
MQLLTLEQVLKLHKRVIEQSGGAMGVRNQEGLESALAQPRMSPADQGLYPTLIEKVAALGFSLINNLRLSMVINVLVMPRLRLPC